MKSINPINQRASQTAIWLITIAMTLPLMALARGSRVAAPKNRYKPSDDVQFGLQAAAKVERQLPTLPKNSEVDAYRLLSTASWNYERRVSAASGSGCGSRQESAFRGPRSLPFAALTR